MNDLSPILIYSLVTGLIILLVSNKKSENGLFFWYISITTLYVVPPLIDDYLGSIKYDSINFLAYYSCIANIAFTFGYLTFRPNTVLEKFKIYRVVNFNKGDLFFLLAVVAFFYSIHHSFNSFEELASPYLVIENFNEQNTYEKIKIWSIYVLSTIFLVKSTTTNNKIFNLRNIIYFIIIILVISILILRGNRNLLAILIIPSLVFKFNIWKYNKTIFFILTLFMLSIGQIIDYVRAIGFSHIDSMNDIDMALSIGEFGQAARGLDLYFSTPSSDIEYGATYTLHVFYNLLTNFGFPFSPLSTYYSNLWSIDKIVGYGFSPVLESYINFGYIGFIVYIIFGIIIKYINNFKNSNNFFKFNLYFIAYPLILNFQRIDFPVLVKIFILPVFILYLYSKLKAYKN